MRAIRGKLLVVGAAALVAACEPASVTDAHDQLGRNGQRITQLTIPIALDTFRVAGFLPDSDTVTTANGLVGVKLQTESLSVDVGQKLKFDNLAFDAFTFSYAQMLTTTQVSTAITLPAPPPASAPAGAFAAAATPSTLRFNTNQGASLQSATVGSGYAVRTIANNTGCAGTISVSLVDSTGATVASFPDAIVADGVTVVDSANLAGTTVSGFVTVNASGTFGVCIPAGSVSTDITFLPMTLASVTLKNISESFTQDYNALQGESRIQAVDTVVVASGSFSVTAQNRLPMTMVDSITLNGVTVGGVPLSGVLTLPAAPGDGTTTSGVLNLNLTNATILPGTVSAHIKGLASAGLATISPTVTTNAVVVNGGGSLTVERLAGALDPARTPELTVAVQNSQEMPASSVDFGSFGDAINGSSINDATATLTVVNTSGTRIKLVGFTLGVVQLDALGQLKTKPGGALDYEVDSLGQPILVKVVDPGDTLMTLRRATTSSVDLQAAPLINRLVHLILDGKRAAVVSEGSAEAGDGAESHINRNDVVQVTFALTAGLDFTVPDTGVVFHQNEAVDGLNLGTADADDLASRIVNVGATSLVVNGTPFGVTVDIALIEGEQDSTTDIFSLPGHTQLATVTLAPGAVDTLGRVTRPDSGTVSLTLDGNQARPMFGKKFTAGIRLRLVPGTGAGGRGAIRSTDHVTVNVRALLDVRGGTP